VTVLGNPEVSSIQHLIWQQYVIASLAKGIDQLGQKFLVFPKSQPFDVFEDAVFGLELFNDPHIVEYQLVARVIHDSLANHGETLARGTTEHTVDIFITQARTFPNFGSCQINNTRTDHG